VRPLLIAGGTFLHRIRLGRHSDYLTFGINAVDSNFRRKIFTRLINLFNKKYPYVE
jgi:hypothetical protein